jgi:hypothetical protein
MAISAQKTTSRIEHILLKACLKSGNFVVAYTKMPASLSKYAIPTLVGRVGFLSLVNRKKEHICSLQDKRQFQFH